MTEWHADLNGSGARGTLNAPNGTNSVEFKRRKCRNFRQLFVKIKFSDAFKHLPEVHFRQLISVNEASAK